MHPKRLFCLFLLSLAAAAQGPVKESGPALDFDPQSGLMWVKNGNHLVTHGLALDVVMSRTRALAAIAAMNDGEIENYGYRDWRLATAAELEFLFEVELNEEAHPILNNLRRWAKGGEEAAIAWPVRGEGVPVISDVVVFAINSAHLRQDSDVLSGDVVVNEPSTSPPLTPHYELTVDVRATTPAGYSVKADNIRLKNNSVVGGDIYSNNLKSQGTVLGTITDSLTLPVFENPPAFLSAPNSDDGDVFPDIEVPNNGTLVVGAGDFGDITIGKNATLIVTGGVLNVDSVNGHNSSRQQWSDSGEMRIRGLLTVGKDSYIGPENALVGAADIVYYVAGSGNDSGDPNASPPAVSIGRDSEVAANIYAPNGTLQLRHNTNATGAFFGKDVLIDPGVQLSLDSAFVNQAPVAADDSARVSTGGTVSILESGEASVLANDSDPDGNNLSVTTTPVSGPDHGTLVLNADGTFSYTHDGGTDTGDSFVYEVCDDGLPSKCTTATVSITIIGETITVTVTKAGTGGGTVESDPEGIDCGPLCSNVFGVTEPIFLVAIPDANSVFGGWSGDTDCSEGLLQPDGDKSCIATFNPKPPPPPGEITVTVSKAGAGNGTVTSIPSGINCGSDCTEDYPIFTRILLFATPNAGSVFTGWSGDLDCLDGQLNGDEDKNCIANFGVAPPPPQTFDLRIQLIGTGGGTVSTSPPSVFCTDDCTVSFASGTMVGLSARPDSGSSFISWGGDCSGFAFSTNVNMDSDKTCTATFSLPSR